MYAPFKSNNISIHSAGVVECCSERVLFLHILPLGVHTALWSGKATIIQNVSLDRDLDVNNRDSIINLNSFLPLANE